MKKLRKILLLAIVCCILAPICSKASAKPTVKESAQVPELSKWILDEAGTMLYAISEKEKCLLFINAASMKVEKKITFEAAPTDLIIDGNELVIAHNSSHEINMVDVKSRTIEKTIKTENDPYSIAKDGDKLFYSSQKMKNAIYEHNIVSGTETCIAENQETRISLATNTKEHMLYVAKTESRYADIWYYDIVTRKRQIDQQYEKRRDSKRPVRNVYCDGKTVYYAGYRMDASDIEKYEGDYGEVAITFAVEKGVIYADNGIYDQESYRKIASYPTRPTLVAATNTAVYLYDSESRTIRRYTDGEQKITTKNVASILAGKKEEELPQKLRAQHPLKSYQVLEMRYELSDMVLVEAQNTIYGVSEINKALFFINATTLDLEKSISLNGGPTKIRAYEDRVYILLQGINQIVSVDGKTRTIKDCYRLKSMAYGFAVGREAIYYGGNGQLIAVDKKTGEVLWDKGIGKRVLEVEVNEEDQILYYTFGYVDSVKQLGYYDLKEKKSLGVANVKSEDSARLFYDGTRVYFEKAAFDKKNPKIEIDYYDDEEDILFVKNGRVYTESYVFDAATFEYIDDLFLEEDIILDVYDSGHMLYYSQEAGVVERVDEANRRFVVLNYDGGDNEVVLYVDKSTYLKEPKQPVRPGYRFLGWYEYGQDTVKWEFSKKVINEHTYLVAKWERHVPVPSKVKAYSNSSYSVDLCWEDIQIPCEYEVYRATSKNGKYSLLTTTSYSDYQDYSVEVGRTYYYKVRTIYKEEGQSYYSAWSEPLSTHSLIGVPRIDFKDSSGEYIIPLTWTKVEHADGYELYRSTSKNGKYQMVSSTKKTELIEKNLPLNKTYYYKVRAYKLVDNKKVYSAYSQVKSNPLNVQSVGKLNLKKVTATSVLVDWNDYSEGTVYEVYEAVGNSGTFVYKGTEKYSRTIVDGLEYGMTYAYKVRKVVKQNGKNYYGPFCSVAKITTAKKPMSKLKASVTSKGLVNVSYGKVSGMHGYEIYRATSQNGKYTLAGTSKGTSFTDKKAAVGQTYYYKVRAYRNVGKNKAYTADSNVVKVSMAVGAPAKANAVKKNATTIAISWNKVKEASGYEVYQSTSKNGSYKKVGTTKGNSITNAKLKKGKTYYYKVRAYRQIGTKKTYSKHTKVVAVRL